MANQTQNLAAALQNFDQVLKAHDLALNSSGSALDENARAMENLNKKIDAIKASWAELILAFANSESIGKLLDSINNGIRSIAENEDAVNIIIKIAKGLLLIKSLQTGLNFFIGLITSGKAWIETGKTMISNLNNLIVVLRTLFGAQATVLTASQASLLALVQPLGIILGLVTAITAAIVAYKAIQNAPTKRLERDKATLEDTKKKYKEITEEYETLLKRQQDLISQGKDLNDGEKKRLELLKQQTSELENQQKKQLASVASSTVGTLQYTQTGTKTVRKQGSEWSVPTEELLKGQKAFEAITKAIADATEQYAQGEITLADYKKSTDELNSQLDTVYEAYMEVISSGGELNAQDKRNYETLVDLKVAWVQAEGASSNYAKALASVSPNTEVAIKFTDKYRNILTQLGGTYYYVSQAAKDEAVASAKAAKAAAEAELQSVQKRILAHDALSKSLQVNALTAGKNLAKIVKLQNAIKDAEAQLQAAQNIKVNVPSASGGTTGGDYTSSAKGKGFGKDASAENKKKAQALLAQYKKQLEEFQKAQEDAYKKREITAAEYYSSVQKKGYSYYKKLKSMGKDYADSAQSMLENYKSTNTTAVKNIFTEIEYRYKQGQISGQQYYDQLWKYAKKFYKNGKIDFDSYRDYVSKGYEAMFENIKSQYEAGRISAEEFQKKVIEAQARANESIRKAGKSGILTQSEIRETRNALVKAGIEATNEVAKALKQAAIDAAQAAVDAAEKALKEAQARQTKANAFIDAIQFWANEQTEQIDKAIDGYNDEIDKLREQMDLLDKQNEALDEQAERLRLVNALEESKKQKTVRVYTAEMGWIWTADPKKVQDAQKALDDFDTEQKRKKEKQAIQDQINALEKLIKEKEKEKQAYQDVINEQTKALERYNIEAQLGMTIEQAIFEGRTQNFNNWKNSYIAGTQEVIAAIEAVNAAQAALDSANARLDYANNIKVPEIKYGESQTLGAGYQYSDDMSSQEKRNAAVRANIEMRRNQGYQVREWYDDKGNLHYEASSTPTSKKNVKSGDATKLVKRYSSGKRATGDVSIAKSGLYNVNELGDELIVPPKGNFDYLKKGTGVVPANLTKNLMDWGKYNPKNLLGAQKPNMTDDHSITIQNLTVQSNDAKDFVRQLQNIAIVRG